MVTEHAHKRTNPHTDDWHSEISIISVIYSFKLTHRLSLVKSWHADIQSMISQIHHSSWFQLSSLLLSCHKADQRVTVSQNIIPPVREESLL